MLLAIRMSKKCSVRATVISGLRAGRTGKESADFNNISLRTVCKVSAYSADIPPRTKQSINVRKASTSRYGAENPGNRQ